MHQQNTYFLCLFSLINSYDSWLSTSDVEGEVEEAPHSEKPWRVSAAAHIQTPKAITLCMQRFNSETDQRLYINNEGF